MPWFSRHLTVFAVCLVNVSPVSADLVWPTPNPAFQRGDPIESFVQPTASGRSESGLFGCVRNDGNRFHEGLDLSPIGRDRQGEATDAIFAVLPGTVVYVSRVAGHSSYGRYVVVEHDGEVAAFHSLYAHLASFAPGIEVGARLSAGTPLGIMGRSASYSIPKSRAHLHLELGFRLTDDFQKWYDRQNFTSENRHGVWNGMNLIGVDPLAFYSAMRSGEVSSFIEFVRDLPIVARIRIHSATTPSFVRNFPALLTRPIQTDQPIVAWDIAFSAYGLPKAWTPRFADEEISGRNGDVRLLAYSKRFLENQSCRRVVETGSGDPKISPETLSTLKKLFGYD